MSSPSSLAVVVVIVSPSSRIETVLPGSASPETVTMAAPAQTARSVRASGARRSTLRVAHEDASEESPAASLAVAVRVWLPWPSRR